MEATIDGLGKLTDEQAPSGRGQPVVLLTGNSDQPHEPGDFVTVGGVRHLAWIVGWNL